MVKICQTGLLTLNFESIPKKRLFRFLPKISAGHAWSWKNFFANFQILGPLGCQGWVVMPQNVKKSQNHCTLMCIPFFLFCTCRYTLRVLCKYKRKRKKLWIMNNELWIVPLSELSLNIVTGIINPNNFKNLGLIIPDRCVPFRHHIQGHNGQWSMGQYHVTQNMN